ncbi:hypothetical protein BDV41DRAFT_522362 [Aspergillus transmontanensis]|uniref:Uncharacterized protein n=1 Tax=Aspergillus transmontanensis TaxID=1034304 RepID=A0A5N6WDE1_9EURO|nr:hypothetical protein BDV41DRAFT_522362 [Aspergillus transmontanensis]
MIGVDGSKVYFGVCPASDCSVRHYTIASWCFFFLNFLQSRRYSIGHHPVIGGLPSYWAMRKFHPVFMC